MLIAQISDTHIVPGNAPLFGRVDTPANLERAIEAINALPTRPDLVIGTGDLVNDPTGDNYQLLAHILGKLNCPFYPVVGNHDSRELLAATFGVQRFDSCQLRYVQYVIDGELRIVVLDTLTDNEEYGGYCEERLAWLNRQLANDRPTLIAMHHPPFPIGVSFMDAHGSRWASEIEAAVERCPSVVRVICGHVHRATACAWGKTCATTAPSTGNQVFPDLRPGAPPQLSEEAPGFALHRWSDGRLVSFNISVPGFGMTFPPWH